MIGDRSGRLGGEGSGAGAVPAAATGVPGKRTLTEGLAGVVAAPSPDALLTRAASADPPTEAGAMGAQAGVDASVFRGDATHVALGELGVRGAARGDQVFVTDDDPHVLGHELAHVAQGGAGGDREGTADRAASAWAAGGAASVAGDGGGAPLGFYGGHVTGTGVRVRATPGGDVIGQLQTGDRVEVGERQGDWVHIHATTPAVLDGWSAASFIAADGAAAPDAATTAGPASPASATPATATPATATPATATPATATPATATPATAGPATATPATATPGVDATAHPPDAATAGPQTPAPAIVTPPPAAVSAVPGALPPGPGYATTDVNLRDHPGGQRLELLAEHDLVTILDGDATNTHVRHGTVEGWVATRYVASGSPPVRAAEQPIVNAAGPLADAAAVAALDHERGVVERRAPAWISALQTALAVDAAARTGALNQPTVQAIAQFQQTTMHATPTGRLDPSTVNALTTAFPALAAAGPATLTATGGVSGPWADDAALAAQHTDGSFLGVTVHAHPLLLARLAAADAYLQGRFPGQGWSQIRGALGVRTGGVDAFHVLRGGGSYHAKGWAIDVDYGSNPWVGGQSADAGVDAAAQNRTNDEAVAIIWRAVWLTGRGEVYTPHEMRARVAGMTTDQIWAHVDAANTAFHAYLAAHGHLDQIRGWIAGGGGIAPMASRAAPPVPAHSHANRGDGATDFAADLHRGLGTGSAEDWNTQIEADLATYRARGGNFEMTGAGARSSLTMSDQHLELVRAMRDAGGLAWGASDIEGEQAGDFMHFDTRTLAVCHNYMDAHRGH